MTDETEPPLITRKTWEEFRAAGLLWWINRMLHTFGWAIVVQVELDGRVTDIYPARIRFRGFDASSESAGFKNLTEHFSANAAELTKEANE